MGRSRDDRGLLMKKFVLCGVAAWVVVAGCLGEPVYNRRLEETLEQMKYEKKINESLNKEEQGSFREKELYLRAPQPLTKGEPMITVAPGSYDLVESFAGAPQTSSGQASPLPIRMHVLMRWKKPPQTPGKKAAPAPPPTNRGPNFEADVRALLANVYGNPNVTSQKSESVNARGKQYKRVIFKSGADTTVRAYFYESGNHLVALVLDIPPALADAKAANQAAEYMLETMAVGNAARNAFAGRPAGDASSGASF
jgi:hypothetical protein